MLWSAASTSSSTSWTASSRRRPLSSSREIAGTIVLIGLSMHQARTILQNGRVVATLTKKKRHNQFRPFHGIPHHPSQVFFPPLEPHGPAAAVGVAERGLNFRREKPKASDVLPILSGIKMLQEVQRMLILQKPALVHVEDSTPASRLPVRSRRRYTNDISRKWSRQS